MAEEGNEEEKPQTREAGETAAALDKASRWAYDQAAWVPCSSYQLLQTRGMDAVMMVMMSGWLLAVIQRSGKGLACTLIFAHCR